MASSSKKIKRNSTDAASYGNASDEEAAHASGSSNQDDDDDESSASSDESEFLDLTSMESGVFSETEQVMRLYNKLRSIQGTLNDGDIEDTIQLPQIAFCGNQSAGKSSCVEAISGVPLPRNNSTTTRAKTELRMMTFGTSFQCVIKLHREGKNETQFGTVITRREDVDLQVQRAQKALLNPRFDPDEFLNWNPKSQLSSRDPDELQFTNDSVVLELSDPRTYNLTLVDLPGLITNDRDENNIEVVREMNESVLKDPNTIIVTVINATEDENLAGILSYARRYDPDGTRTLGVLTKLDRVEEGNKDALLHRIYPPVNAMPRLKLGYYAVRNRTQQELENGVTPDEAKVLENRYFDEERWLGRLRDEDRCGVDALKMKLSELLVEKLKPLMRRIKQQCHKLSVKLKKRLEEIPRVEFNSVAEFQERTISKVYELARQVKEDVDANGVSKGLAHEILEEFRKFELNLYHQRPIFQNETSVKLQGSQRISPDYDVARTDTNHTDVSTSHRWTFERVTDIISDQRGAIFIGFDVFDAVRKIVRIHQEKWEDPTRMCVESIHALFRSYLHKKTDSVFKGAFSNVAKIVRKILTVQLESAKNLSEDMAVKRLFQMEVSKVFSRSMYTLREQDFSEGITNYTEKILKSKTTSTNGPDPTLSPITRDLWSLWSAMIKQTQTKIPDAQLRQRVDAITSELNNILQLTNRRIPDSSRIATGIQKLKPEMLNVLAQIAQSVRDDQITDIKPKIESILNRDCFGEMELPESNVKDDVKATEVHKVMAGALSYYSISHYRYLDVVTRSIYVILVADFTEQLSAMLHKHLGLGPQKDSDAGLREDRWKMMTSEDMKVTEEREKLEKLRKSLKVIVKEASKIGY